MYPGRYFVPNMAMNQMMLRNGYNLSRNGGIINKMIAGLRSFDWSKFLNGTNKTLNVVNQAIPLVKQVKPMVGNIKSMVKLVRAFGRETTPNNVSSANSNSTLQKKEVNDNYPNFFI